LNKIKGDFRVGGARVSKMFSFFLFLVICTVVHVDPSMCHIYMISVQCFSAHGRKFTTLAVGSRDFVQCERTFVAVLVPLVYYWWNQKPICYLSGDIYWSCWDNEPRTPEFANIIVLKYRFWCRLVSVLSIYVSTINSSSGFVHSEGRHGVVESSVTE
jgi:hypothetical protein